MTSLPTLRRELIAAFALVFAGAFLVAAIGIVLLLPRFDTPTQTVLYLGALLLIDVSVFAAFGNALIQHRVLKPIDRVVANAEAIAKGQLEVRVPDAETHEMARLSEALNHMAQHLIADQQQLAANIRSLDDTNRLLTEARDAMVQSEKMASVGRLGAGIAHEVGNPLGAIIGYLAIIGKRRVADPELIQAAEREAQRIDRIVRGLLDYSRPRGGKPQRLDVAQVVQETLELVSTQGKFKRIKLQSTVAANLPNVNGDPFQLQQVLVNLLVNAADALEEHPDPIVSLSAITRLHQVAPALPARRKDDHPAIDYTHRRRLHAPARVLLPDPGAAGGAVVEIMIRDNGPGIPEELIDQIFEPFVTTKEVGKGTGLGLAVCARLIEGMGGIIRAESNGEAGAAFRVVMPALPPDELQPREDPS